MRIKTVGDFRKAVRMSPYAWPGAYPVIFTFEDGQQGCHSCVVENRRTIIDSISVRYHDGWSVVAIESASIYDEVALCACCGEPINPQED